MKDNVIIQRFWDREEGAISAVAEKYGSYCYRIAQNILDSHEDSEECVNDTWLRAWNSIPPHRPERLATYLGKLTGNIALNRYQQKNAQKRGKGQVELALSELENCVPDPQGMEKTVEDMVLVDALEKFLLAYPRTERNIFLGRYWYLYSLAELASAYGMRESRIASLLYRMRKRLKLYLQKEEIFL